MYLASDIRRLIKSEIALQGVSSEDMANSMGVGVSTYYGYMSSNKSMELRTIERLCAALGVRLVCRLESNEQ